MPICGIISGLAREQLVPYTPISLFFGAGDDQRFLPEETGAVTEVGLAVDALIGLCDKL